VYTPLAGQIYTIMKIIFRENVILCIAREDDR